MFFIKTMSLLLATIFGLCLNYAQGINYTQLRTMAAKHNMTCILVFGDSSVDPGNNNHLITRMKSNFPPYGMDFFHHQPSGRFCNGRLATDFIAEALGYSDLLRAFLDPNTTSKDLLHGVSFASAGSGYDELTVNLSNVLSMSKQLEYFRHYIIHLSNMVGKKQAQEIIRNALVILSMGTNDFLQNYYLEPNRSKQYDVEQYQNYLISCMQAAIKTMHSLGVRKLAVVGLPPFGCMPVVRTFRNDIKCDIQLNKVASSFNLKIQKELKTVQGTPYRSIYVDIYTVILNAVANPRRYGFREALKGCCGSGSFEYGSTCGASSACHDPTKYVFWDALHPTEKLYKIVADHAMEVLLNQLF